MSTSEKNQKMDLLKKKTKRKTKSRLIREINNLKDYWDFSKSNLNLSLMNIKKKVQKRGDYKNIKSSRSDVELHRGVNEFKSPIPISIGKKRISNTTTSTKNEKSLTNTCHRYIYNYSPSISEKEEIFFSLNEILSFLKISYGIDYENYILKDEQKQEFKVKLNNFLKEYTTIYNSSKILIRECYLENFFEIISKFINVTCDDLSSKFCEISKNFKEKRLNFIMEYTKPTAFVCENQIKIEENNKKKVGHYAKYKTIPKWHHYAWDMINFIFSQFGIEEAINAEHAKRRIDLGTITLKLKLKIYNNIFEFIDEMMKMIRFSTDVNNKIGNSKNVSFCKMIEVRMQKQIKKLKDENKI